MSALLLTTGDKLRTATVCFADVAIAGGRGDIHESVDSPGDDQTQRPLRPHTRRLWRTWGRGRGAAVASLQSESLPHLPSYIERLRGELAQGAAGASGPAAAAAAAVPSDPPPPHDESPATDARPKTLNSGLLGLHHRLTRHLSRSGARLGRRHRRKVCGDADPGPPATASADTSPEMPGPTDPPPGDARPLSRPRSLPELPCGFGDGGSGAGEQFSEELSRELSWLALGGSGAPRGGDSAPKPVPFYASSEQLVDACGAPPAQTTEPSSASLASAASSLTLAETGPEAAGKWCAEGMPAMGAVSLGGNLADAADYEGLLFLTAHTGEPDVDGAEYDARATDENAQPAARAFAATLLDFGEEDEGADGSGRTAEAAVHRWWPRCILPAHNMQYMPKLSTMIPDPSIRSSGNGSSSSSSVCDECMESGGTQLDGPVDEAMASAPGCSTPGCPNYIHAPADKTRRLLHGGWHGGARYSLCQHSDYWDILSRCPMRPTSSLALASLRDMVRACAAAGDSRCACMEPSHAYAALSKSSDSDSSNEGMCLAASSSYLALRKQSLRGPTTPAAAAAAAAQHHHRGGTQSCKQKRSLSEPMQYILYNSYLRYYGQPGSDS
ncbi:hypothetical protein IWQ57_002673 [Coemansia nantahalensis]|uniref:Uncharacterized protein n=1 Tax=Coemansia nantahalensis TaxID=2789366 RepID=A0ACC1JZQ1_9FUNG|nr:hypothetical protein IWQ57_002673 [Coemansia nantahalensis]